MSIELDTPDGGMVIVRTGRPLRPGLTDEMVLSYVKALLTESSLRHNWLWCESPSKACCDAVRAVWDVVAPGFTRDVQDRVSPCSDEVLAKMISHSGLGYHFTLVDAETVRPTRARARRLLKAHPELAKRTVAGYRGSDNSVALMNVTLEALLAVDGSCIARNDTDPNITKFSRLLVRGESIDTYIIRLAERV